MKKETKLKVYYDGLCMVCSKEINYYKNQIGAENIDFIDIFSTSFDPVYEGVDPVSIHRVMHARRPDGTLATRMDAFIEIWKSLPKFRRLAQIAQNSYVRMGLDIGYLGFSKIRPWLPRYKKEADCQQSPYCESNLNSSNQNAMKNEMTRGPI